MTELIKGGHYKYFNISYWDVVCLILLFVSDLKVPSFVGFKKL